MSIKILLSSNKSAESFSKIKKADKGFIAMTSN